MSWTYSGAPSAGGIVAFDYTGWSARYRELSGSVSQSLAQLYFNEATLYLDNTATSIVRDTAQRGALLGMITAHIAALNAALNGQASSPLVGRINSASEGSVSVQVAMDAVPGTAAWFMQTKYGAAAWQAMAGFRTMHYRPGFRAISRSDATGSRRF